MESTNTLIWEMSDSDWHEGKQNNWKNLTVLEWTSSKNCILVLIEKKINFRGLQRSGKKEKQPKNKKQDRKSDSSHCCCVVI